MFYFFRKFPLYYRNTMNQVNPINITKRFTTMNHNQPPSGDDWIILLSCIGLGIYYFVKKPPSGGIAYV